MQVTDSKKRTRREGTGDAAVRAATRKITGRGALADKLAGKLPDLVRTVVAGSAGKKERVASSAASSALDANALDAKNATATQHRSLVGAVALASVLVVLALTLTVGATDALAQSTPGGGGGGGDAIQQTLTNVRDYLATLSFAVGGIGFVASLLVKGYASINENAHAYAAMGMKGSLWCIVAGVIVTPILTIAAGLAGGGG